MDEFGSDHLKHVRHMLAEHEQMEFTPEQLEDTLNDIFKRTQAALKAEGYDLSLEEVKSLIGEVIQDEENKLH